MIKKNNNCTFCKIINGEIKTIKILEDNDILIIFDVSQSKHEQGHMLIITKKHYDNILLVPQNLMYKIASTIQMIGKIVKKLAKGLNIVTNIGKSAKQTIMHCHIHIIPRKISIKQKNTLSKIKNIRIKNIIKKIQKFLSNLNNKN